MTIAPPISWIDFEKVDLQAGTTVKFEPFPEAQKPTHKLWVDLGTITLSGVDTKMPNGARQK
jgi:tRNA-binding protein